jgi:hypothetical protein
LEENHPNDINWTRDEQLAYWINAYNAFTVKLVCDHFPVAGIKDIRRGISFINSVWDIRFIRIGTENYDLNKIEHGILRKKFDEPRIHFAINCASISCPNLLDEAYEASKIDSQLTSRARTFLSNKVKNNIQQETIEISRIFKWFRGDFTKHGTLIDFLNQYAPVQIDESAAVEYLDYDWSLNVANPE